MQQTAIEIDHVLYSWTVDLGASISWNSVILTGRGKVEMNEAFWIHSMIQKDWLNQLADGCRKRYFENRKKIEKDIWKKKGQTFIASWIEGVTYPLAVPDEILDKLVVIKDYESAFDAVIYLKWMVSLADFQPRAKTNFSHQQPMFHRRIFHSVKVHARTMNRWFVAWQFITVNPNRTVSLSKFSFFKLLHLLIRSYQVPILLIVR